MKIGKSAVVLLSALLVVSAPRPWLTPVRAATAIIATPTRITRVVITAGALAAVRLRVRERCDELLRKAIAIDTPDPRYWNAYDACIGL